VEQFSFYNVTMEAKAAVALTAKSGSLLKDGRLL
jgi:hypothetical protein